LASESSIIGTGTDQLHETGGAQKLCHNQKPINDNN